MESVESKVVVLDEKINVANKRISDLEAKTENMPKIEVLMDLVVETNKEQTETLKSINENMTGLNNKLEHVDRRVEKLEKYSQEDSENSKIDLNQLRKDIITKVIPSVIGGLVLAWFLIQFGLK